MPSTPAMKPIAARDRLVRSIYEGSCRTYRDVEGAEVPGMRELPLDENRAPGTGFYLLEMEPGAISSAHEHGSDEYFFMLQGELIDHDGTCYREGDMVLLRAGTQHESHTPNGCRVLVFVDKPETLLG